MFGQSTFKEDFSPEANAINQALFEDKQGQLEAEVEKCGSFTARLVGELRDGEILSYQLEAADFGLAPYHQEALAGGISAEHIHMAGYDMGKAVTLAHTLAQAPEVVLLSPACASFDMYDGMAERGRDFKRLVNNL